MCKQPPSIMFRAVTLVFGVLAVPASACAQGETGWLRGEGGFDAAVSFAYEEFEHFWIGDRRVEDPGVGRVERRSYNLWLAYGLTDDLDVSLAASYVDTDSSGPLGGRADFQDLALRLKWRAFDCELGPGRLWLLAAPAVKVPMGHYEEDFLTAIGDEQVDLRARVIAQYTFECGLWFALETGYDVRFEAPANEFPLHVTVGGTLADIVTLSGFYSRVDSLGGYDIGEGRFPGLEEDYERLGIGLQVRLLDELSLSVSGWTTLDGKNTADVDGFSVGAVLTF